MSHQQHHKLVAECAPLLGNSLHASCPAIATENNEASVKDRANVIACVDYGLKDLGQLGWVWGKLPTEKFGFWAFYNHNFRVNSKSWTMPSHSACQVQHKIHTQRLQNLRSHSSAINVVPEKWFDQPYSDCHIPRRSFLLLLEFISSMWPKITWLSQQYTMIKNGFLIAHILVMRTYLTTSLDSMMFRFCKLLNLSMARQPSG